MLLILLCFEYIEVSCVWICLVSKPFLLVFPDLIICLNAFVGFRISLLFDIYISYILIEGLIPDICTYASFWKHIDKKLKLCFNHTDEHLDGILGWISIINIFINYIHCIVIIRFLTNFIKFTQHSKGELRTIIQVWVNSKHQVTNRGRNFFG